MYSNISRIILQYPDLLNKFANTNNDICDYIYSDPFSILVTLDLKHKFLTDPDYINEKYDIVEKLNSYYHIFDHLKNNPRPVLHQDYVCVQFDSKYLSLANCKSYADIYLSKHPDCITDFLVKSETGDDDALKKRIRKHIFYFITSRDDNSQHSERSRNTDWVLPDDKRYLFDKNFLDRHDNYYLNLERKTVPIDCQKLITPGNPDVYKDTEWQNNSTIVAVKNLRSCGEILNLIFIAKEFINEYGGYIGGSAALAFFNFFNNGTLDNFRPDDIDVLINDEEVYNRCIGKYQVVEIDIVHDYSGFEINKIGYIYYKNTLINLLLVKNKIKEHVSKFDYEFCRLLWDGENFDKSSSIALASAKYRRSYFNTRGTKKFDPDRYMKYTKRGYEIILY